METTIRQRAGERGLPMGLPLLWRTHRLPRAKVCMFSADLINSGTCLMTIFRVTLRRRKVRPLTLSPGLLDLPGYTEKASSSETFIFGRRKIQEHEPGSDKSVLVHTGKETCQILVDQNEVGIDRRFTQNGQ